MVRVRTSSKGSVVVFVAVSLLMFLALVALVIDIGYGLAVKTQLHEVADAAALAATARLDGTLAGIANAQNDAIAYAANNSAAGYPVTLGAGDIEFGYWDMPVKNFNPILPGNPGYPEDINAVRVTARRDTASGTALATTFARTFGQNTMDVKAHAVAEKGGPSQCIDSDDPTKDCNPIPLVICKDSIIHEDGSPYCGVDITVGSTPTQSGALTSYFDTASEINIRHLADGTTDSPSLYARPCSQCPLNPSTEDQTGIEATWGTQPGVFAALRDRYNDAVAPCIAAGEAEPDWDCEGSPEQWYWKAYVTVTCASCEDPDTASGPVCVSGFASIDIEEVCTSQGNILCEHTGDKSTNAIYGHLRCGGDSTPDSGTGGPNYGTYSPNPGLVE